MKQDIDIVLKPYFFIIPLVIYPFDVIVSIDEDDNILLKRLLKKGIKEKDCKPFIKMSKNVVGRAFILPSNETVIRFKTLEDKSEMAGNIAHEVFHAVTFILERVGVKFDLNISDEAYAYLIGHLTTEIYKNLKYTNIIQKLT